MRRVLLACVALALLVGCQSGTGTWGGGSRPGSLHAERPGTVPTVQAHLPKATDPDVQADVARAKSDSKCADVPLTEIQLAEAKAGHGLTCPAGSEGTGTGAGSGTSTTSTTTQTPITLTNSDVSAQTSVVVTSTSPNQPSPAKRKLTCPRPVFGRCPIG